LLLNVGLTLGEDLWLTHVDELPVDLCLAMVDSVCLQDWPVIEKKCPRIKSQIKPWQSTF